MTETWPEVATCDDFNKRIGNARLLVVGAGGIGCELLKTLALSGFKNIEVIDMDTIETSNLNRQFLFRKRHVSKSKAEVAAQSVKRFRPDACIKAHKANVKDPAFSIDFFKSFDVVLNGLDNMDARRHVNRLCLAADVPLIESGTTGFRGQVTVHIKGNTTCYECTDKPTPKTYPICTIRNTPDKPIHCVVWAKELLFPRLFGKQDGVTDLDDQDQNANGKDQENSEQPEDKSFFEKGKDENSGDYARRIFTRVFESDIQRVSKIEDMWVSRDPPKPLNLSEIVVKQSLHENGANNAAGEDSMASASLGLHDQHKVWSVAENARVFLKSIEMFYESRGSEVGSAVFDKDDELAVDFVTAASNLRAASYAIPMQNLFTAKGMAGNIIHAVATTNAIISGLAVVEAFKVLSGCFDRVKESFIAEAVSTQSQFSKITREMLVKGGAPCPPSKSCVVCGTAKLSLKINTESATLTNFVDKVLKKSLSVNMPTIMCGDFLFEDGEGLDEDEIEANNALLPKTLSNLPGGGLRNGAIVSVNDQSQAFGVDIIISHQDDIDEEEHPELFILEGDVPVAQPDESDLNASKAPDNAVSSDSEFYMSEDECDVRGQKKRSREAADNDDNDDDDDEVVILDGDDMVPNTKDPTPQNGSQPQNIPSKEPGKRRKLAG